LFQFLVTPLQQLLLLLFFREHHHEGHIVLGAVVVLSTKTVTSPSSMRDRS
jgi:hypothetical protein